MGCVVSATDRAFIAAFMLASVVFAVLVSSRLRTIEHAIDAAISFTVRE